MRYALVTLLIAGTWFGAFAAAPGALDQGLTNPGHEDKPAWFKTSFLDIREDVADAAQGGRRVILYFYQDGCPYCAKLLHDNFADRTISEQTQTHFDVIAINMWGDREVTDFDGNVVTEKTFAASLKVQFTPTLLFLDELGRVLLRINGYFAPHKFKVALDYVAGRHEGEGKFNAFYAQAAPRAASGDFYREGDTLAWPLKLADNRRSSTRHLVVLFEQRQCGDCDELHQDILRRREVGLALTNLDVAQLDMFSTDLIQAVDGREMPARDWARELNVRYSPTLVFFDTDGKEVFRTEAYLKSFHIHGALDYVATIAYRAQPSFQRFLQKRREALLERGFDVDLME